MNLPADIVSLIQHMEKSGVRAFVVGGAVRDLLMGRDPEDYDMAAECTPCELIRIFDGFKTVTTGIRFGTLSVWSGERFVEITCCRSEKGYSDLRRPDELEYCKNIEKDLARRDFTVNAVALSADGTLIDPFGGVNDIQSKTIKAVGNPEIRFGEDALRIIRALRFASTLGFEIEDNTAKAVKNCRKLLPAVSGERLFSELKKLLLGDFVLSVLTDYSDVICTLIPELSPSVGFSQNNPHHIYTVYEHIARTVAASPKDISIRLCMLLHDIAKPHSYTEDEKGIGHFYGHPDVSEKMAKQILKRFKADSKTVNDVCFLIKYHDTRPAATRKSLLKYVSKVGFDFALKLVDVRRADLAAQSPTYHDQFEYLSESETIIRVLHREGACTQVSDLAVNGNDLIEAGVPKGKAVGDMLSYLLSKIINEEYENEKEALLKLARRKLTKNNKKINR